MRMILSLSFALIAIALTIIGTMMPRMLPAQAARDRAYYETFKAAADSIRANGRLPAEEVLRRTQTLQSYPFIRSSLTIPSDCDRSFKTAPGDRLVLSFWRGEWTECYAHPSGRTTLPMSVRAYLLSGVGANLVVYWLLAAGAAWCAFRLYYGRWRLIRAAT